MIGFSTTFTTSVPHLPLKGHVLEQAGREQALEAAVDPVGLVGVAGLDQHVGADRALLDALVTFDLDCGNGAVGPGRTGASAAKGRGRADEG